VTFFRPTTDTVEAFQLARNRFTHAELEILNYKPATMYMMHLLTCHAYHADKILKRLNISFIAHNSIDRLCGRDFNKGLQKIHQTTNYHSPLQDLISAGLRA